MAEAETDNRNTGAGGTTGSESGPTTGAGGATGSEEAGFDAPAEGGENPARDGGQGEGGKAAPGSDR